MSLILDALRRADSDRERGAVPGLHAQPVPVALPELPGSGRRVPWLSLTAALVVAALVAALAWMVLGRDTARPAAATAVPKPMANAPAVPPMPAEAQAPRSAVPEAPRSAVPPAPLAPTAVANPATAAPVPRPGAGDAQSVAEPAPWPAPEAGRRSAAPEATTSAARAAATPASPPPAAGVQEAPLAAREQLPENIRAQLPPLAVGGSIYSANPGDRSVIIDGRLLRENDRLSADLSLEQIRPKSAVLRFKNYRFEIAF